MDSWWTRPARPATAAAAVTAAALVLGVAGCTDTPPPASTTAEQLASALSAGNLSDLTVTGAGAEGAAGELDEVLAGMDGLRPQVTVADTQTAEDDQQATVTLDVAWDLPAAAEEPVTWGYTTTADLVRLDDEEQSWALTWSPAVLEPSLSPGEGLVLSRVAAARGDVLGAGRTIVTDRPVLRIGVDKTQVVPEEAPAAAAAVADLLDIDPAAFAERVAAAGPQAFVEGIVLREDDTADLDRDALAAVPGALVVTDEIPLAPTREFARPLLGTVGEATAEVVEASAGTIAPGDVVGLSGLQRAYDDQLRGQPGLTVTARPADGNTAAEGRELFTREPVPGQPLATTLDPDLQALAEDVLAPLDQPSAIVAVQPSTGAVLAAASGPGSGGLSTATEGRYPPGSTFKVVTALGLLRAGVTPEDVLDCTAATTVEGRPFTNYSDYPATALGQIPLRLVIANSCNTALIAARDRLPQPDLAEAAAALGIGADYDPGVPAFTGSVPTDAGATEHAASMIGQGRVEASPLAMAAAAATITRGSLVTPHLLDPSSTPQEPAPAPPVPLTDDEATQLQAMMRAVVTDGSATFLADVPGAPVGAKTGTAEYGTDEPLRTHAWMIGTQGDLAVAVLVEDGASGARTAGPLLEQFLTDLPTDQPAER